MTTLICAGGSGTRVLESILHLCAAGLGPDSLRLLVIDPDASNGNTRRTRDLLNSYVQCQKEFGRKLGGSRLFHTEIDLLTNGQSPAGLTVWSPVGNGNSFSDILNYELLSEENQRLVHLFFTDEELAMPLDVGFRGHPSLGAAAMALLSLFRKQQPWRNLVDSINQEVTTTAGSKFVLIGSVFGGTGASAIHPLARFLRSVPSQNKERLKIGVVALVPYFQFMPGDAAAGEDRELAARSEWFALATKAAVEYYDHLRKQKDWDFDAMYWLGDDGAADVRYSPGGPNQENPAHFVDLLAALAALDFFAADSSSGACHFSGPTLNGSMPHVNVVSWRDLPLNALQRNEVETSLLQLVVSGAVHLGFLDPLLKDRRVNSQASCVPWYFDRFAARNELLTAPANRDAISLFTDYSRLRLLPWLAQLHSSVDNARVQLFNRASWNLPSGHFDMRRLANLLWPDEDDRASLDGVDHYFTDMVTKGKSTGTGSAGAAYLAMVATASSAFIAREYKQEREAS